MNVLSQDQAIRDAIVIGPVLRWGQSDVFLNPATPSMLVTGIVKNYGSSSGPPSSSSESPNPERCSR